VFVDADVTVHPDTLGRFARLFADEPELSAAFGSYDALPAASGTVSQFRNLLHHYVHQQGGGAAETFWSGCGAIRRGALLDVGMFDEWHYNRPQVEDIEMGRRLRMRGHRIELHPEIQGTHLKRWTLGGMLATDFAGRGVPWMRLLLQEGTVSELQTLNLRPQERLSALLAVITVVTLVAAGEFLSPAGLLASAVTFAGMIALNRGFYAFLLRVRGPGFLLAAIPLHLLHYLTAGVAAAAGWVTHTMVGAPWRRRRWRRSTRWGSAPGLPARAGRWAGRGWRTPEGARRARPGHDPGRGGGGQPQHARAAPRVPGVRPPRHHGHRGGQRVDRRERGDGARLVPRRAAAGRRRQPGVRRGGQPGGAGLRRALRAGAQQRHPGGARRAGGAGRAPGRAPRAPRSPAPGC
jgi:hypothetical protein